MNASVTKR